jgi:hypothetical protein
MNLLNFTDNLLSRSPSRPAHAGLVGCLQSVPDFRTQIILEFLFVSPFFASFLDVQKEESLQNEIYL